jgi:hypothetical protein
MDKQTRAGINLHTYLIGKIVEKKAQVVLKESPLWPLMIVNQRRILPGYSRTTKGELRRFRWPPSPRESIKRTSNHDNF